MIYLKYYVEHMYNIKKFIKKNYLWILITVIYTKDFRKYSFLYVRCTSCYVFVNEH